MNRRAYLLTAAGAIAASLFARPALPAICTCKEPHWAADIKELQPGVRKDGTLYRRIISTAVFCTRCSGRFEGSAK